MFSDILVILLVLVASYLFKISEKHKLDTQLMFVLLAIMILVVYKLAYYKKITSVEGFNTDTISDLDMDVINNWINQAGGSVDSLSDDEKDDMMSQLSEFKYQVLAQNRELKEVVNQLLKDRKQKRSYGAGDTMDLTNTQTLQNEQIKNLEDKFEKARELLGLVEMEKTAKKYPKIPVYSSCVVSNADGGYTLDTPNLNAATQQLAANTASAAKARVPAGSSASELSSSQQMADPKTAEYSNVEHVLVNYLNNLSNQGINVNIS